MTAVPSARNSGLERTSNLAFTVAPRNAGLGQEMTYQISLDETVDLGRGVQLISPEENGGVIEWMRARTEGNTVLWTRTVEQGDDGLYYPYLDEVCDTLGNCRTCTARPSWPDRRYRT